VGIATMSDMMTIDEEMAAARASGGAQERRRLNRIFRHPAAAPRNDELAQSLAFGTDRTADEIIQSLKAAGFVERRVQ
jgi:hypothetical protein